MGEIVGFVRSSKYSRKLRGRLRIIEKLINLSSDHWRLLF